MVYIYLPLYDPFPHLAHEFEDDSYADVAVKDLIKCGCRYQHHKAKRQGRAKGRAKRRTKEGNNKKG